MMSTSFPAEEWPQSGDARPAAVDAGSSTITRDRRGWFYRLMAPGANCAVLEVGEGFAGNWFANVVKSDLDDATTVSPPVPQFDLLVMHYALGGCKTLGDAIGSASRLLRRGGVLAIASENRLRLPGRGTPDVDASSQRATGWGLRSMMVRGGFTNVALFFTHPPGDAPVYVVHADRLSAREFFRASLKARRPARWSPVRLASIALIELNLAPYLEPGLLVVGEKC